MSAFWIAMCYVFAAEMGDKTQFVCVAFGAKYKARVVFAAITVATALMLLVWTLLGETAGALIPQFWLNITAGMLFIIFGLWALKTDDHQVIEDEDKVKSKESHYGPFMTVAITFFLAELGDKTLLATATIAAQQHDFFQVWIGATIGMLAADAIGLFLGKALKGRISEKFLSYATAAIFILTGIYTLWLTLRQQHS